MMPEKEDVTYQKAGVDVGIRNSGGRSARTIGIASSIVLLAGLRVAKVRNAVRDTEVHDASLLNLLSSRVGVAMMSDSKTMKGTTYAVNGIGSQKLVKSLDSGLDGGLGSGGENAEAVVMDEARHVRLVEAGRHVEARHGDENGVENVVGVCVVEWYEVKRVCVLEEMCEL
jgi:hypothetical protein